MNSSEQTSDPGGPCFSRYLLHHAFQTLRFGPLSQKCWCRSSRTSAVDKQLDFSIVFQTAARSRGCFSKILLLHNTLFENYSKRLNLILVLSTNLTCLITLFQVSKCKRSSLRSQCWMRLFWYFQTPWSCRMKRLLLLCLCFFNKRGIKINPPHLFLGAACCHQKLATWEYFDNNGVNGRFNDRFR